MKVALRLILEAGQEDSLPMFQKRIMSSTKPYHGRGYYFGHHGTYTIARVRKLGKGKNQVVKPSRVTNYIY